VGSGGGTAMGGGAATMGGGPGSGQPPALLHNRLFLATRRVKDLEARLHALAAAKGFNAEVDVLAKERDVYKLQVEALRRAQPRVRASRDGGHAYDRLREAYLKAVAERNALEDEVKAVHDGYNHEMIAAHDHLRGLVAENVRYKHEANVYFRDQSNMEQLDRQMRRERQALNAAIKSFEAMRASHERRLYSRDELSELRDLRHKIKDMEARLAGMEHDRAVLERQFKVEYDARQEAELELRYGVDGRARLAEQHAVDSMQLEMHQIRQEARETERRKNQEILALKQHVRAAHDERNQAVNRLLNTATPRVPEPEPVYITRDVEVPAPAPAPAQQSRPASAGYKYVVQRVPQYAYVNMPVSGTLPPRAPAAMPSAAHYPGMPPPGIGLPGPLPPPGMPVPGFGVMPL